MLYFAQKNYSDFENLRFFTTHIYIPNGQNWADPEAIRNSSYSEFYEAFFSYQGKKSVQQHIHIIITEYIHIGAIIDD